MAHMPPHGHHYDATRIKLKIASLPQDAPSPPWPPSVPYVGRLAYDGYDGDADDVLAYLDSIYSIPCRPDSFAEDVILVLLFVSVLVCAFTDGFKRRCALVG